ncbi:MAG: CHASE2 domain-containing protein [Chthoniobacterales bacterium]
MSFDGPAADPAADAAFADAIRANGKVILGGVQENTERQGVVSVRVFPPIKPLRKAALGWGLLVFNPVDPDYGVRQIYFGTNQTPTATWRAAEALGAPITRSSRDALGSLWLNYYGPPGSFSSVSFGDVLAPGRLPPGYFNGKIVLIGGKPDTLGTDYFVTPFPFTNPSHAFIQGTEVHATILLNLLRGEWLTRIPISREIALIVFVGLVAGGLALLRSSRATLLSLLISIGIACGACWLVWHQRIWFAWLIPSAVQMPFGLAWAVSSQFLLKSRQS